MNDKRLNYRYQAQQALMARMQKEVNTTPHWAFALRVTKANALPLARKVER